MRGISHKELLEIDPWQHDNQQDLLNYIIEQCQEFNPWMTLEEFLKSGFIGTCWVYTNNEYVYTAYYAIDGQFYESDFTQCRLDRNTIVLVMPLHKPEPVK